MKAYVNRIFGKRDACKELAEIFLQISREGYKIDEVMVGAVLEQYRKDKLDVVHRHEARIASCIEEEEFKKANRDMIADDKESVARLGEYFVPMDKNLNQSIKSIVYEMLQRLPQVGETGARPA